MTDRLTEPPFIPQRPSRFADNLDRLMGLHGLTSEKLAELVGVSRGTITNWRTGAKEPNLSGIVKLVELFEIDALRMTQLDFDELLDDVASHGRFLRTEARIYDAEGKLVLLPKKDAAPS